MAFVKIPGLAGKLYVPDKKPKTEKKHACKDCFACQDCGDDRCQVCRREHGRPHCRKSTQI